MGELNMLRWNLIELINFKESIHKTIHWLLDIEISKLKEQQRQYQTSQKFKHLDLKE